MAHTFAELVVGGVLLPPFVTYLVAALVLIVVLRGRGSQKCLPAGTVRVHRTPRHPRLSPRLCDCRSHTPAAKCYTRPCLTGAVCQFTVRQYSQGTPGGTRLALE